MFPGMYQSSIPLAEQPPVPTSQAAADALYSQPLPDRDEFENFFDDALDEFSMHGQVKELHTVQNRGEHLLGNVYVQYADEAQADAAMNAIKGENELHQMLPID